MTKQEKQIPALLNDRDYMAEFFRSRLKDIDLQAKELIRLNSHNIKAHQDENFFHYVTQHNLTILTEKNLRRRYTIMCIAFSGHRRRKMFQVLEQAYHHGFEQGEVIVPRPLWYINELMALFYVAVPGDNLLEHLKNGHVDMEIIQNIARGLAKLHRLNPPPKAKLKKHSFNYNYLDPTNVLERPYNRRSELSEDVKKHFKKLKTAEKILKKEDYRLSHGDFHPENVIINRFNTGQAVLIDFSETCLAPVYYDIGSFLQQLKFMTLNYLSNEEHQQIEYAFLTAYFNRRKITDDIYDRINLYKAWTALKSVVYFMIFEDSVNRQFAKFLLTQAEDFYREIKCI